MPNSIKQIFSLAINPTSGQELSQEDKNLMELITAVLADPNAFRVVLEPNNPNTDSLKDQITNEIEQHLKDQGVDPDVINGLRAKVNAIAPQAYDKYLTTSQLATALSKALQGYLTQDKINKMLSQYVTQATLTKTQQNVNNLQGQSKVLYDNSFKNSNSIKALAASLKSLNSQMTTISTEVTKNIDSLEQSHLDYNELIANNASQDELDAAVKTIQTKLDTLKTTLTSIQTLSSTNRNRLDDINSDSAWQRTFTIYTGGTGLPDTAPGGSIEIDAENTYVDLYQFPDNDVHRCYVNVKTRNLDGDDLPVINVSYNLNITAWKDGWGPIRALEDYFLPKDFANINHLPDFGLRLEHTSDGKNILSIKINTARLDTITIGEL